MAGESNSRTVTTRVHSALRVVIRGFPLGEGAKCVVAGQQLLVLKRAKREDWPDATLDRGDLEAVLWTTPGDADRIAETVLADERVISVRVEVAPLDVE